jgi:hypothetical protein
MEKINKFIMIAILSILALTTYAQCGCSNFKTSTQHGTAGFALQSIDIINFPAEPVTNPDGSALTTYDLCVYNAEYDYELTNYECDGKILYTTITKFDLVGFTKTCNGVTEPSDEPTYMSIWNPAYRPYGFTTLLDHFRANLEKGGKKPFKGMLVNAGCYSLIAVTWPANAFCTNAVTGENASGKTYGTVYPPANMYVPCFDIGCCTINEDGSRNTDKANCTGYIDNTKLVWKSPCGTIFKGNIGSQLSPCAPSCGSINVNKMAVAKPDTNGSINLNYFNALGETLQSMSYSVSLSNQGNTLTLSSIKDIKQVNIFDLQGKKTKELKSISSREIDFAAMQSGIYLVQLIKTDNTVLIATKIKK